MTGVPHPGARLYQVQVMASCCAENKLMADVATLFDDAEPWLATPRGAFTVEYRANLFRSLSRMGCLVHSLLKSPNLELEIQIFMLLLNPDLVETFLRWPRCRMNAWTRELLDSYPTLSGAEFLGVLELHAMLLCASITTQECKNAAIRRFVVGKSVQTHMVHAQDSSAAFLFQGARRLGLEGGISSEVGQPPQAPVPICVRLVI